VLKLVDHELCGVGNKCFVIPENLFLYIIFIEGSHMLRETFYDVFKTNHPVVTPVIHVLNVMQAARNIELAGTAGAAGVFLINHDFDVDTFLPMIKEVRTRFPEIWMGVNFLAVTGKLAFPILAKLEDGGCRIDAYWADDARILERSFQQLEAEKIAEIRGHSGWKGLYFGGTAFKKQRPVLSDDFEDAASRAVPFMDVVTTSGAATGQQADLRKILDFRSGASDHALAVASGITPENVRRYASVDCFLVATGINISGDFYNIDRRRLNELITITSDMEPG
tara:strand:+ start:5381 stop:6223 length:843 start_codon:yes stop_codon:yes gene_type:complete